MLPMTATPGVRLAQLHRMRAGVGTYTRDDAIFASIAGTVITENNEVRVIRAGKLVGSSQVLRLGDSVICKVVKVTSLQVLVDIVCVRDAVLQETFPGTIRIEDVGNHNFDKVAMETVFSPGMLVKAMVLSFGDTRSYFLTTAKPGLGVVRALSNEDMKDEDVNM